MKETLYICHNANKPLMAYDFPHVFGANQLKEAAERCKVLNARKTNRLTNKKGWEVVELGD